MAKRQIIAMGGGGFLMEPDNPLLDHYILDQAEASNPKICYLGTASGGWNGGIVAFYTRYTQCACQPSHISFFQRTPELREVVLAQDIIYVGGGNTKSMLAVWREWGLDSILREAWEAGTVMAGVSAGAICWFEQGITDSIAGRGAVLDAMGFVPGSFCPHYDGEAWRQSFYRDFLESGEIAPGYALDDGVAVHLADDEPVRFISSRPDAMAYRMGVEDGVAVTEPVTPDYLGAAA